MYLLKLVLLANPCHEYASLTSLLLEIYQRWNKTKRRWPYQMKRRPTRTDSGANVVSQHQSYYYFFVFYDRNPARLKTPAILHTHVLDRMTRLNYFDKRIRGLS